MNLIHLGRTIKAKRQALGLSQERLAKLGGLSRATINQLECGALHDLGANKLFHLLSVLGVSIEAHPKTNQTQALALVSQTASVSYNTALQPAALGQALLTGQYPTAFTPHLATLLDEAPLSLIVSAVQEVAQNNPQTAKQIWKHLCKWAREFGSLRMAWS
jgi:transcriptional regulator with XRE-family HTH domain